MDVDFKNFNEVRNRLVSVTITKMNFLALISSLNLNSILDKMDIVRAPYKRTRVIASQGEDLEQHIVTPGLFI